ncbi:MAG: hypothetical protein ACTSR9_16680 [Candidatus Thorarchaeota archaeon]
MSSKSLLTFKTKQGRTYEWEVADFLRGHEKDFIELYGASMQVSNEREYVSIDLSGLADYPNFRSLKINGFQHLTKMDLYPFTRNNKIRGLDVTVSGLLGKPWDITPLFESLHNLTDEDYVHFRIGKEVNTWLDPRDFRTFTRRTPYKVKYRPLTDIAVWEPIHTLLEVVKGRTSHFTAQQSIFHGLGLGRYGFLDKDLVDVLLEVPPVTPLADVRSILEPTLIETMCEQVEAGGTTIGIMVDDRFLKHPECAKLSGNILEMRKEEMERVRLPVIKNRPDWESLHYTAYGYEILKAIGRKIVSNYSQTNTRMVHDTFRDAGIKVLTVDFESQKDFDESKPKLTPMSEEMKAHIRMTIRYL